MAPRNRNNPKASASSDGQYTRADLDREFPDDATCLNYLWRQNCSPDGQHAECPKCGVQRRFHRVASRPSYSCDVCGHHLHPTAGTIFHKSSTGLDLWFRAIFLMGSTRCGVSAKQLERELGVTYKTAWRMARLIREQLMPQDSGPLSGDVEMDETYMGGKPRLADRRRIAELAEETWGSIHSAATRWADEKKTPIFGMVERGGKVAAYVVPDAKGRTLGRHVEARVLPATIVYTDEAPTYVGIAKRGGYEHKRIHHAAKVYVEGDVHTQTIDGFWSLVKRGISGTHHAVSRKYLQNYLDEFVWRYNNRTGRESMFKKLLNNVTLACGD